MATEESKTTFCVNGNVLNKEKEIDKDLSGEASGIEDKEIEEIIEDDLSDAPIDRGWAWVILAASVFEIIVYGGILKSFGVFFLQYQMRFHSSASETALMSLIQNVVLSTTALLVMTIGLRKFSSRVAVLIGGTCTVAAYLITAFATDIKVFYLAQGVIGGVGLGMIHPPMLAIIGVYFHKHRGLANSIFTGGASVGGLIFAPVVVKLFDEYQFTGAMLIMSGLLMNIWVSALVMRPIESYSRKKKMVKYEGSGNNEKDKFLLKETGNSSFKKPTTLRFDEIKMKTDVSSNSDCNTQSDIYKHSPSKGSNFSRMQSFDPLVVNQRSQESPLLQRVRAYSFVIRKRTLSDNYHGSNNSVHHSKGVMKGVIEAISRSQVALYASSEGICGSFIDVNIPSTTNESQNNITKTETKITDKRDNEEGCFKSMKSCIRSVLCTVFDLGLLRNPVFITYLFMAFSIMSGVTLVPVYVPPHAKDIGISNERIGLLLSLMAVVDLVAKLTMGVVADRKWIKRSTILVISTILLGTTSHIMRFVNSFQTMIVFVVIAGICCGQYVSVYAVLLMDVIGPEKFKSSLGFGTLVHGASVAVFFPIAGLLRDFTGSYVASFHLLGGLAYLAGVLAFIIPIVNKWKKRKEEEVTESLKNA